MWGESIEISTIICKFWSVWKWFSHQMWSAFCLCCVCTMAHILILIYYFTCICRICVWHCWSYSKKACFILYITMMMSCLFPFCIMKYLGAQSNILYSSYEFFFLFNFLFYCIIMNKYVFSHKDSLVCINVLYLIK